MPPVISSIGEETEEQQLDDDPSDLDLMNYPKVLPILPLRGVVVYPQTAVPLTQPLL